MPMHIVSHRVEEATRDASPDDLESSGHGCIATGRDGRRRHEADRRAACVRQSYRQCRELKATAPCRAVGTGGRTSSREETVKVSEHVSNQRQTKRFHVLDEVVYHDGTMLPATRQLYSKCSQLEGLRRRTRSSFRTDVHAGEVDKWKQVQ